MAVLIFIIVGLATMTCFYWWLGQKEKQRSKELSQLARTLGMSYSRKVDREFRKVLRKFAWASRRYGKITQYLRSNLRNKMTEKLPNAELTFFECSSASQERQIGAMEGVFYFKSSVADFSTFRMKPAIQAQQMFLSAFGVKDINFDSHPAFSQRYLLEGDEVRVRQLFSPNLLDALERLNDRFHIEAHDNQMVIYRSIENDPFSNKQAAKRVSVQEFKTLKQQIIQIFQGFNEGI